MKGALSQPFRGLGPMVVWYVQGASMPIVDNHEKTTARLFAELRGLRERIATLTEEEHQRVREKQARIILDHMYQFVGLVDVEGILLDANQTSLDASGMERSGAVGRPFWEGRWWAVSAETQRQLQAAVERAARGEFVRYEVEVFAGDAGRELVTCDFSLKPVTDEAGHVVFLVPEGRNITEKKLAEAEIVRKNAELHRLYEKVKELDELKSRFFSNVSHELRTPLSLILGPAQKLLTRSALSVDERHDLEVIERNARILLKHVNDLLDVAKLEAGRMIIDYAEDDLARLVRFTVAHFDVLAQERQIACSVETPAAVPAQVDSEKVQRVLVNLFSNAFKFVPDGGVVRCVLRTDHDRATITVEDNGPGVPTEFRDVIFERFHQLDGSTTRRFGGTGLGLAIAKEFVELHGGTVTVDNAAIGGALFRVEIPLSAPPGALVRPAPSEATTRDLLRESADEPQVRPQAAATPQPTGRPLVLIVEDNPDMNRLIADALAGEYRTASAFDGREGLEKAVVLHPDLILTDVMMPRMSGDQLLRELRAHLDLATCPIVLITAKADDELRVRLLRDGAQDYVTKPVAVEELRARVKNLITTKQARDVLERELAVQNQDVAQLALEVTARKRELQDTLETLRESEGRYRSIFENALEGIFRSTPEGRFIHVNPALVRMLGYESAQEVLALDIPGDLYVTPSERGGVLAQWGDVMNGVELRLRRKNGEPLVVSAYARGIRDTQGVVSYYDGLMLDVTERKRAQEAMLQLAAIVESSADAIIGKTLDGVITSWNAGATKIYGYAPDEALGQPISMLIPPDRPDEMRLIHERIGRGERVEPFETVRMTKDRRSIDVSLTVSPIRNATGAIVGASAIARDITERKRAETTMREQAALAHLGQMAAVVAHEIKNPLAGIRGALQVVGSRMPSDEPRPRRQSICH